MKGAIGSYGTGGTGSGLLGFAGSAIGGLASIFSTTAAAGGPIHRANGGLVPQFAAGGRSRRDMVPAWLEPGEFVVRRQAVQQTGLPTLQGINRGSGSPNVSVNINNNGTPQQADGNPDVKFDGRNYVIDIVTSDLRNNGPIRRSIKGLRGA